MAGIGPIQEKRHHTTCYTGDDKRTKEQENIMSAAMLLQTKRTQPRRAFPFSISNSSLIAPTSKEPSTSKRTPMWGPNRPSCVWFQHSLSCDAIETSAGESMRKALFFCTSKSWNPMTDCSGTTKIYAVGSAQIWFGDKAPHAGPPHLRPMLALRVCVAWKFTPVSRGSQGSAFIYGISPPSPSLSGRRQMHCKCQTLNE